MSVPKPIHWFRHISECGELTEEPLAGIEYLNTWTGETFVHTCGTAYWDPKENVLNRESLMWAGVTHYRLVSVEE